MENERDKNASSRAGLKILRDLLKGETGFWIAAIILAIAVVGNLSTVMDIVSGAAWLGREWRNVLHAAWHATGAPWAALTIDMVSFNILLVIYQWVARIRLSKESNREKYRGIARSDATILLFLFTTGYVLCTIVFIVVPNISEPQHVSSEDILILGISGLPVMTGQRAMNQLSAVGATYIMATLFWRTLVVCMFVVAASFVVSLLT